MAVSCQEAPIAAPPDPWLKLFCHVHADVHGAQEIEVGINEEVGCLGPDDEVTGSEVHRKLAVVVLEPLTVGSKLGYAD